MWFGISGNDYALLAARAAEPDAYAATGVAHSIVANRVSYVLDLHGPSVACDTACSSSLVALHQARRALLDGECDLAIVGGVNLILDPALTRCFAAAGMMAADGRCKTFDEAADGYGRGEGCGVVVLKRLADARRDGDRVRAVVLGSAVVNDGATNGLTAPSGAAQRDVVRRAHADAGVAAAEIAYVETHGTGTVLGDRIEVEALAAVLGAERGPIAPVRPRCRQGKPRAPRGGRGDSRVRDKRCSRSNGPRSRRTRRCGTRIRTCISVHADCTFRRHRNRGPTVRRASRASARSVSAAPSRMSSWPRTTRRRPQRRSRVRRI